MSRNAFVCLDFSLDRLAVLEVTDRKVSAWTVHMLPPGSLRGGDPVDPADLGAKLRSALAEAGISATRARIALSDDAAVVRVVDLPAIPRRHLGGAVRYLAEQETPFPPGQANLTWDVVAQQGTNLKIYIAAAWRDVIQRLGEVTHAAGLVPEIMEPRSLALSRAIGRDQAIILDAAQSVARLTFVSHTQAPFVDQLPAADGDEWETANRLLTRALRSHTGARPVALLAGDLEAGADWSHIEQLPVDAQPVSSALNGRAPLRPWNMPGGELLAPFGLAMRGLSPVERFRYPVVNLMTGPRHSATRLFASRPSSRRSSRLLTAAAVAAVLAIWAVVGVGAATLLGMHPRLPLGP